MSNLAAKIVIIEDDLAVRRYVRSSLLGERMQVLEAESGRLGISLTASQKPDLMILDLGLPDMDGMAVIREIRDWTQMPIIILSARGQEKDKVAALDAGADDYLTKPFNVAELLARVRVALRHAAMATDGKQEGRAALAFGDLKVDFEARRVTYKGNDIHLTKIEYKLLTTLARNAGKVLTHSQICREVWGRQYDEDRHPIRVYFAALRRKIEPDPANPRFILTEQGVGYRMIEETA